MDIKTFEYKMRDWNGFDIAKGVVVWTKKKKQRPLKITLLPSGQDFPFETYEELYNFTLPDGRKVKNLIDRLTDEDFKMVLH